MGKISPVSAKYIVHAYITIDGVVDRPDVIGAIFGQTEGLLGSDLELRELQRSGRIGRIEVNVNTSSGRTSGEIIIPSSLDKTETAIVAAALEIIQRIGPCTAKVDVRQIEDVRISKRNFVVERAKQLLRHLTDTGMPDSQELTDEVAQSVRVMEIQEYGRERLPAGPAIDESDEVIVVEGRADVLNLLKHGFKNCIAINGTSVPPMIKELSRKKTLTAFVDGDRGGDLILRELLSVADIDFVCKAPDGKEVEEITKKEIHKALRGKITSEQARLELNVGPLSASENNGTSQHRELQREEQRRPLPLQQKRPFMPQRPAVQPQAPLQQAQAPLLAAAGAMPNAKAAITPKEKKRLKSTLEELFGTRAACVLDRNLSVLGKVPLSELQATMKSLDGNVYAIVLDGTVDKELIRTAEEQNVSCIVGVDIKARESEKVSVLSDDELNVVA